MARRNRNKINSYVPISKTDPLSPVTEQYRKLRTNIELSNFNEEIRVIAITSSMASEGKTLTALNLAEVYSQSNLKTLMIDLDLRKPKVHRGFLIINDKGISDVVTQNLKVEDVIYKANDNLDVITAGTKLPFPAEFLMSHKLRTLINQLKTKYDRIIVDTPPMSAVTDASIISTFCDGTLLVVANRTTRIDIAYRAIKDLQDHGANVLGAVMTKVRKKENEYYNYAYYNYNDRYYQED